jgi:hypothetical protein
MMRFIRAFLLFENAPLLQAFEAKGKITHVELILIESQPNCIPTGSHTYDWFANHQIEYAAPKLTTSADRHPSFYHCWQSN